MAEVIGQIAISRVLTSSVLAGGIVIPERVSRGRDDARGDAGFCAADGSHAADGVRALCGAVRWQSQGQERHVHGSVPVHGVRAADFSQEAARHRGLPALPGRAAQPHGNPGPVLRNSLASANAARN